MPRPATRHNTAMYTCVSQLDMSIYLYTYIYKYTCIYIRVYIYIWLYIYIHMYAYLILKHPIPARGIWMLCYVSNSISCTHPLITDQWLIVYNASVVNEEPTAIFYIHLPELGTCVAVDTKPNWIVHYTRNWRTSALDPTVWYLNAMCTHTYPAEP